jgi:Uma2 family endonuclease
MGQAFSLPNFCHKQLGLRRNTMPVAMTERPARVDPSRKRWTRVECEALCSTGLFAEQKLELIEGDLINKAGKTQPHVVSTVLLLEWLMGVFGTGTVLHAAPIDVAPEDNSSSEPEPDLMVLARPFSDFTNANPQPRDLQLVIEVADSTLSFDLTMKASLYARAGIADYWVLDLTDRRMLVHRDPQGDRYASVVAYDADEKRRAPGCT